MTMVKKGQPKKKKRLKLRVNVVLKLLLFIGIVSALITYSLNLRIKNIYIVGNNTTKDVEIIENWRKNGKITNEDADEAIASMKSKNKYLSTNQNGTKYARFAHIYRLGVKSFFYKGITYSDDEAINGFNKYINDNSHLIN